MFGTCKSISRKYSIFQKCYFLERKMFSCVWLHFKKISEKYFLVFAKKEGKDKPRKTQTKPRKKNHQRSTLDWLVRRGARSRSTLDWVRRTKPRRTRRDRDRRHDLVKRRSRSSEAPFASIAIDGAIYSAIGASRSTARSGLFFLSLFNLGSLLSLSLSLSFSGNTLK